MIPAIVFACFGIFACGIIVGWLIGYEDGKQMMRDAHGLPQRAHSEGDRP